MAKKKNKDENTYTGRTEPGPFAHDYEEASLIPPDKDPVDPPKDAKHEDLEKDRVDNAGTDFTTNQGLKMQEDEFTLTAGDRGPSLLEDFHYREKITHFDHERIPERVVHARGSGAYGEFVCTKDMSEYTAADFLRKDVKTPVFARFSTVAGFRGSPTPRAMSAVLPSSCTRSRAIWTSSETIFPCSLCRMRSNSPTLFTP